MRAVWMQGFALLLVACGKVKDPTPKGTVLFDWDRSAAKLHDMNDIAKEGAKHPVADAKIVEGPKAKAYTVNVKDVEGKVYSFDVDVESAKVSYPEKDKEITRWATTKVSAKLQENEAFRITGSCDNRMASVMGAIGEITDTMMDCRVVAKRPNSMGTEDAITHGVWMQIQGNGEIHIADPGVELVER